MICNVIDECRCYAYDDVSNPKKKQFCGVRRGPHVLPCPKGCCAGGCPGKIPKQPFHIIKRPKPQKPKPKFRIRHMDINLKVLVFLTIILASIFLLLL